MGTNRLLLVLALLSACAPTPAPQIVLVEERPDSGALPEDAAPLDVSDAAIEEAATEAGDPVEAGATDAGELDEGTTDAGATDVELEAEAGCGITCQPWEVCGYTLDTNDAQVPECHGEGSCYAFPENCGGPCLGSPQPDPCGISQGDPLTVFVTCADAGPPSTATCKRAGEYYCCEPGN
jgi:hypothetical protein